MAKSRKRKNGDKVQDIPAAATQQLPTDQAPQRRPQARQGAGAMA